MIPNDAVNFQQREEIEDVKNRIKQKGLKFAPGSMVETAMHIGGIEGPAVAKNVVNEYLVEASSLFATFVQGLRSTQRVRGPQKAGSAHSLFTHFVAGRQQQLTDQHARSFRGQGGGSSPAAVHQPLSRTRGSSSRGESSSAALPNKKPRSEIDARASPRRGSKAGRIKFSADGDSVCIGQTYNDLKALKKDLATNDSAIPAAFAYVALLRSKTKAERLAWCPAGVDVPACAFELPFPGFDADTYQKSWGPPRDF